MRRQRALYPQRRPDCQGAQVPGTMPTARRSRGMWVPPPTRRRQLSAANARGTTGASAAGHRLLSRGTSHGAAASWPLLLARPSRWCRAQHATQRCESAWPSPPRTCFAPAKQRRPAGRGRTAPRQHWLLPCQPALPCHARHCSSSTGRLGRAPHRRHFFTGNWYPDAQ
jgi:hypothetical protein